MTEKRTMHLVCYHCYNGEFRLAQPNDWRCVGCGSSHAILVSTERLRELREEQANWEGEGGHV